VASFDIAISFYPYDPHYSKAVDCWQYVGDLQSGRRLSGERPDSLLLAYSVEKLEILRPPFFRRKSLVPKMALTFLV
jgi:hypothetical protein